MAFGCAFTWACTNNHASWCTAYCAKLHAHSSLEKVKNLPHHSCITQCKTCSVYMGTTSREQNTINCHGSGYIYSIDSTDNTCSVHCISRKGYYILQKRAVAKNAQENVKLWSPVRFGTTDLNRSFLLLSYAHANQAHFLNYLRSLRQYIPDRTPDQSSDHFQPFRTLHIPARKTHVSRGLQSPQKGPASNLFMRLHGHHYSLSCSAVRPDPSVTNTNDSANI